MPVAPSAFYNEIDPFAAHLLRRLIDEGVIAPGVVSEKSIKEITADDLRGFTQVHFFAGGGLWSVAARQAGWADGRPIWTASCPCQPFSQAGQGRGLDDPRHLWPDVDRLVHECRAAGFGPSVLVGEQVAGAPGYHWFDGVRTDLAKQGYGARVVDIPACAVDAPHIRQRLYWVALAQSDSGRHEGRIVFGPGEGAGSNVERAYGQSGRSDGRGGINGAMAAPAGDGREQGEPRASVTRYGCEPSTAHGGINGAMADAHRGGRAGRPEAQEWGESGRTAAERLDDLVHAARLGRGEGRTEHEFWRGRATLAGADASGRTGSFWTDA